jgi:hypothetical protein
MSPRKSASCGPEFKTQSFPGLIESHHGKDPSYLDRSWFARRPISRASRYHGANAQDLLHGEGGCGKTTLMQEISEKLPSGSVSVLFDCFRAGRYVHSDDKRHLRENAFPDQSCCRHGDAALPSESRQDPASIRTFMQKLGVAAETLKLRDQKALLLIRVDAAARR